MKGGANVSINNSGHMAKMSAMPIYGKKNPSKIFSGIAEPVARKLDMYIATGNRILQFFVFIMHQSFVSPAPPGPGIAGT